MDSAEITGGSQSKGSAVFPRSARLLRSEQFSAVFAQRRVFRSTNFALHSCPRLPREPEVFSPTGSARLGLVISKRHSKKSVSRNLVKRLARESFRCLRSRLPTVDIVLRLQNRLNKKLTLSDRKKLRQEISFLFYRLMTNERQAIKNKHTRGKDS